MFILGTSSVLAFVPRDHVDLIGPIPQVLSIGFGSLGWVGTIGLDRNSRHRRAAQSL